MKKRITAALLSAAMVCSMTACGGSNSTQNSSTQSGETAQTAQSTQNTGNDSIKMVFSWWGNQIRNERTNEALKKYSELNPGITFDGQFAEYSDYWNKLATASAGHNLPDVFQMDYAYYSQYVQNDLLLDLTPYIEDGTLNLEDADANILESGKIDGKTYAVCIGINAPSLFYNKTVLDEAGITVKDGMTREEFMQLAKEVKEKTGYSTNVGYNNDTLLDYELRTKGVVLYEDGKLGAESAEDLELVFEMQERGTQEGWIIDPSVFTEISVNSAEQDPLVYGSSPSRMSWCMFATSNQLPAVQAAAPEGVEIGITTWPSDDVAKSNYLKPGCFLSVSADCKYPEEAVKVIDYFTNSQECNDILLGERGIPISKAISEYLAPKLDESTQKVVNYINNVVSANCSPINPPSPKGTNEVLDLKNNLEEQVLYGKISAKEAAEKLFAEGNEIMANAVK